MSRRGSRTEGRTIDGERPAASYATAAQPLSGLPALRCACGAMYRDYPDSHAAHLVVHGHRPIRKPAPQPQEGQEA